LSGDVGDTKWNTIRFVSLVLQISHTKLQNRTLKRPRG
jgi:hypothetical protein